MRDTLRFITCGAVGDGKSTLIERLLEESSQTPADRLLALENDSSPDEAQGEILDSARLVDGVQQGLEQSIAIDVAYRVFATPARRFIAADSPGHERSTSDMIVGAFASELAVVVVNALQGLQEQSHRHARIAALRGIRHFVLAVNKMDRVSFGEEAFSKIVLEFEPLVRELSFASFQAIPISALQGDNITRDSSCIPWYTGPTLLQYLETIDTTGRNANQPFRMPVESVDRTKQSFSSFCGRIASGEVKIGDRVRIVPGGIETSVRAIVVSQEERPSGLAGESIALCLDEEVDISPGAVISSASEPIEQSDQFEARILCLSHESLVPGRSYLLNIHTCQAGASITALKFRVDVRSGAHLAAKFLGFNDIAIVNLYTDRPVPFETYQGSRALSRFTLVDRLSHQTVAAGRINFSLRRAANIHWQALAIDKEARAKQKLQKPMCLWLTGLSGSGKSTIANLLEKRLFADGRHTYVLDGDNVRHGLNKDLGFTEADRVENIRRVTEVAKLLVDAGLVVVVSFISPYRAERERARSAFAPGEFLEIFVDAPLEECERRDPKGLYAKVRRGVLKNFTGIDSDYEAPASPEIHLDTVSTNPEGCIHRILQAMENSSHVMEMKVL